MFQLNIGLKRFLKKLSNNKKDRSFTGHLLYIVIFIWTIALGISFLDTITYNGFFLKHTFVNPIIIYVFLGIVEFLGSFIFKRRAGNSFKNFQRVNFFLSLLLFLLFIMLSFIENVTYANFVFSTFHISISGLVYPVILTICTNFILFNLRYLVIPIFGLVLGLVLENNLSNIWINNKSNLQYVFNHPSDSYKQKMENSLGKQFYDYVLFVKENTPENAKILLPPFPAYPWPQTGNIPYMRYFLYPRTLLNGDEYSASYNLKKDGIDYVLLAWGETVATSNGYTHGWPKFDVNAGDIIFWMPDGSVITKKENYSYDQFKGQELWGLIKVAK